jgi:uncharacterized protein YceK
MLRISLLLAVLAVLSGCESFRDYRVQVREPSSRAQIDEPPYYDYGRRETVYTR